MIVAALAPAAGPATVRAALPGGTPVKCFLTDPQTRCSYWASGPGRSDIARVGPWVVRVYRGTDLVWAIGGQGPDRLSIPSQPGDRVEAQIITGTGFCPSPPRDLPEGPRCSGAGAIVLSERLPVPI